MNKTQVIITQNHPLYNKAKDLQLDIIEFGEDITADLVFDLCLLNNKDKTKLIEQCAGKKIISDLTCHNGNALIEKYPQIVGAMACTFASPNNACEFWSINEKKCVSDFLELFGITALEVNEAGIGFTYPRILSMIINEAYFAKEEQVATEEAIDTAMLYGVNYPIGPFEQAKIIGLKNIVSLLDELANETGKKRYRVAEQLRNESKL